MVKKRQAKNTPKGKQTKSDAAFEAEAHLLACFVDFAENSPDELIPFMQHCGIDLEVIAAADERGLAPIILGHYRIKPGVYDIERVANNLATWPRIAAYIVELQIEQRNKAKRPAEVRN